MFVVTVAFTCLQHPIAHTTPSIMQRAHTNDPLGDRNRAGSVLPGYIWACMLWFNFERSLKETLPFKFVYNSIVHFRRAKKCNIGIFGS